MKKKLANTFRETLWIEYMKILSYAPVRMNKYKAILKNRGKSKNGKYDQ